MQYIVGKPLFKTAFFKGLVYIIWAIILFFFGYDDVFKIFSIVLIGIIVLIVIPGIAYSKLMWVVNDRYLKYTYHHNMWDKMISFYKHIFKTKKIDYQISIYLEQIEYIRVTYVALPKPPYGKLGYDVLFKVNTYDGSEFIFESLVTMKKNDFLEAVEFLKTKGILFEDPYCILEALRKDVHLSGYLEKIHKERLENDKDFHPHF